MRRCPRPALYILYWVEVWLITIYAIQNVKMVHLRIVFVCSSTAFDCEEHLQVAVDAYYEWKQKPKHVHQEQVSTIVPAARDEVKSAAGSAS